MTKHGTLLLCTALFILFGSPNHAQQLNHKVTDKNGREKLLGKIDKEGLLSGSFAQWFVPQYMGYEVEEEVVQTFEKELRAFTIKIFLGTWCGDSRREVPRFYKVLEKAGFPEEQLSVIAVDDEKPFYKKSPGGEEKGLQIIKVPTFIFYKNGREVNRIIEYPVKSLESDMDAIVNGKPYTPNYSELMAH